MSGPGLRPGELWTRPQLAAAQWCADFYVQQASALWAGAPDPGQPGYAEALDVIRQSEIFAEVIHAGNTPLGESELTTCAALLLLGEQMSAEMHDDGSMTLTRMAPAPRRQAGPPAIPGQALPEEALLRAARLACMAQLEPQRTPTAPLTPRTAQVLRRVTRQFLGRLEPADARDRPLWRKIRTLLWALEAPRVALDMDHARDALILLGEAADQPDARGSVRADLRTAAAECVAAGWGNAPCPLLDDPADPALPA